MNLETMKPPAAEFFEHALRNSGRPPFVRPGRFLCRPRAQQRESNFFPVVIALPEIRRSDQ